ncbi:MAG: glycosyltransferase family 2 protein [Lachnospiraceae bacterium]|nr:glycosyltransferase family 2 protein [Lachnospiraceae bacterium]
MMKINCVIVNYNDAETVEGLVGRIQNFSCLDRIIIVDNASTDDSWPRLRRLCGGKVEAVQAGKNGGYGAGNNLGIRHAVESNGATHILVANPDVSFTEDCIAGMARVFCRHPKVGVVAAAMEDREFGKTPNAWRLHGFVGQLMFMGPICRRLFCWMLYYPRPCFRKGKGVYVDVVHGSLLMVDGAAFEACKGYDEGIFLYQEEDVLAYRMRALGLRTVLLPSLVYQHQHGASTGKSYQSQLARQRLREKSVLYYMKHYLSICPLQETVAKAWFGIIRLEVRAGCLLGRLSGIALPNVRRRG